jgi:hypothetical protein
MGQGCSSLTGIFHLVRNQGSAAVLKIQWRKDGSKPLSSDAQVLQPLYPISVPVARRVIAQHGVPRRASCAYLVLVESIGWAYPRNLRLLSSEPQLC